MDQYWFTIEEIDSTTFAISEYGHWEQTHSYLLCGSEKALLIDTGLGISNIKEVVDSLTDLPVIVATTHVHWDHIGGHRYFDTIAVHEAEEGWLNGGFPIPAEMVQKSLMAEPCNFPRDFSLENYRIFQGAANCVLHDGDCISLGNRDIYTVHTPGHSPGHCCFYEPERKYLYSGDLIYRGCLDIFYPSTDPYQFWISVQKIQALSVGRILPGHHRLDITADIIGRIEAALSDLSANGKLKQGSGMFEYQDFQIHI